MMLRKVASRSVGLLRGLQVYRRYRSYTMVPPVIFATNVDLCRRLAPQGCIVECGVWRGGMSAGMSHAAPGRSHVLFDSFEGLPPAREIDGPDAQLWQANVDSPDYHANCRAEAATAAEAMQKSRAHDYSIAQDGLTRPCPGSASPSPSLCCGWTATGTTQRSPAWRTCIRWWR